MLRCCRLLGGLSVWSQEVDFSVIKLAFPSINILPYRTRAVASFTMLYDI